eukprot:3940391-Rhodomonas_salina.2
MRYAVSGTDVAYAATRWGRTEATKVLVLARLWCYAMSGTDREPMVPRIRYKMLGTDWRPVVPGRNVRHPIRLRACYAVSGSEIAYAAICLHAWYAMCGTEIAYGYAKCGTEIAYGAMRCARMVRPGVLPPVGEDTQPGTMPAICLRVCYEMSAIGLRDCYEISAICLRAFYEMSGTDRGHGSKISGPWHVAMRRPVQVLSLRALCLWGSPSITPYQVSYQLYYLLPETMLSATENCTTCHGIFRTGAMVQAVKGRYRKSTDTAGAVPTCGMAEHLESLCADDKYRDALCFFQVPVSD